MIKRKKVNFHLIYCFIIGLLLGYLIQSKNEPQQNNKIEIKMHIIKDSVIYDTIVKKFTAKLPLTEKNLKRVLKENNIHHSNVVLAQAKLETGNFTSKVCKSKSNLFGLRKGKHYRSYKHWTESVKDYKRLVQSKYKGGDYFTFLNLIGYAEDPNYLIKLKNII